VSTQTEAVRVDDPMPLEDDWAALSAEVAQMHESISAADHERLLEKAYNARLRADEFDAEAGVTEPYEVRVGREAVAEYRQQVWWRHGLRAVRGFPGWLASTQGGRGLDLFGSRVQVSRGRGELRVTVWSDYVRGREFTLRLGAAQP
jgi:hypothetical protein